MKKIPKGGEYVGASGEPLKLLEASKTVAEEPAKKKIF